MTKFTFAQREEGFDNHIEHSIRGYTNLWNDVLKYSEYFVEDYTNVVDIGCSTGKLLKAMIEQNTFAPHANYVGIEVEEDFFKSYDEDEEQFSHLRYHRGDVRDFRFLNCSLVTSIFTLQFIQEKERSSIIKQIYDGLNPGGAFIFAEKTVADTGRFQDMFTFMFYDYKRKSFTEKDIMDKEVTLRNMLKPNTWNELTDMLHSAGFKNVQPFWRNFLFVGAIATK